MNQPRSSPKTAGSTVTTPGSAVGSSFTSVDPLAQHLHEVLSIAVLQHRLRLAFQFVGADPAGAVGDLLRARDLEALALLERGDELAGLEQAVVGAGVQPGI